MSWGFSESAPAEEAIAGGVILPETMGESMPIFGRLADQF
jgi:hypothetical protein